MKNKFSTALVIFKYYVLTYTLLFWIISISDSVHFDRTNWIKSVKIHSVWFLYQGLILVLAFWVISTLIILLMSVFRKNTKILK